MMGIWGEMSLPISLRPSVKGEENIMMVITGLGNMSHIEMRL